MIDNELKLYIYRGILNSFTDMGKWGHTIVYQHEKHPDYITYDGDMSLHKLVDDIYNELKGLVK